MVLTIIGWVVAAYVYWHIGFYIGHKCWKIYQTTDSRSTLYFLLWPASALEHRARGSNDQFEPYPAAAMPNTVVAHYAVTLGFIWPVKIAWNLIVILIAVITYVCVNVAKAIFRAISFPARKIARINRPKKKSHGNGVS